jgi:predicted N-acetyltransferase YhbS
VEPVKGSFTDDPSLSEKIFELLDVVFPGLRGGALSIRSLGVPWESASTPFFYLKDGRVVSHVGVIEIPLVLMGQPVRVGSLHAVATHPGYRRRGYYGLLMEEALQECGKSYETLILTTENPEYYEPFGFRIVEEHCFQLRHHSPGDSDGLRLIDTQASRDVALLHRLLETREPVSRVVGVVNEKAVFCFNEGRRPLRYAEDLDAIVCMELDGARLRLFDVVGPKLPPLAELMERVPQGSDEVSFYFAPDRLAPEAKAKPYVLDHDGPSHLMARGPFAAEGHPFTLPRSART